MRIQFNRGNVKFGIGGSNDYNNYYHSSQGNPVVFLFIGLLIVGWGIFWLFKTPILNKNLKEISALVTEIKEVYESANDISYYPIVKYQVNGNSYTKELPQNFGDMQKGHYIEIYYNVNNPEEVSQKEDVTIGFFLLAFGIVWCFLIMMVIINGGPLGE